jgi:hypothetical protein
MDVDSAIWHLLTGSEILFASMPENIIVHHPSVKLDHKHLDYSLIMVLVGKYACHLQLLQTMEILDVFHINLLKPAANNLSQMRIGW